MASKSKKAKDAADTVAEADLAVAEAFAPYEDTLAVRAVSVVAKLGDQPPLRALCGAAVAAGLLRGDDRLAKAGLRALAAHTVATMAKNAIKRRIDRTRPFVAVNGSDGGHKPSPGRDESKEETSFPSGHSAGAAAVAAAFARDYPEHAGIAAAAGAAIALAQIPRCAHYPTDVGGGVALGLAAEAITGRLLRQ
jgi:membrane-associated phospholipid phosphatase